MTQDDLQVIDLIGPCPACNQDDCLKFHIRASSSTNSTSIMVEMSCSHGCLLTPEQAEQAGDRLASVMDLEERDSAPTYSYRYGNPLPILGTPTRGMIQ